jgi:hypothetical protein
MSRPHSRAWREQEVPVIPGYLSGALRDKPAAPAYRWRARAYPHAVTAIERAEAQHGEPYPACLCGGRIRYAKDRARCETCGGEPS